MLVDIIHSEKTSKVTATKRGSRSGSSHVSLATHTGGALAQRLRKQCVLILFHKFFEFASTGAPNCAPKSKQNIPHSFQSHLVLNSVSFEFSQTCLIIAYTSSKAQSSNRIPNQNPMITCSCSDQFTLASFLDSGADALRPTRFGPNRFIPIRFGPNRFSPIRFGPNQLCPTDQCFSCRKFRRVASFCVLLAPPCCQVDPAVVPLAGAAVPGPATGAQELCR